MIVIRSVRSCQFTLSEAKIKILHDNKREENREQGKFCVLNVNEIL